MIKTLLLILLPLIALAVTDVDRQEFVNKNILAPYSPGFENGLAGWTFSGGSSTAVSSGSNLLLGKGSATWDSGSASQTMSSTAVTIPKGLYGRNGMFQCLTMVPSGAATHLIQVFDGSNIIASQSITSSATPTMNSINFIFPGSGSIRGRLISVASDEPSITVDDCYLGYAQNIQQVTQAIFIGDAKIVGQGSGVWDNTGSSLDAFSTQSAYGGPVVISNPGPGVIQTTDTDLPRFTVNSLPPGSYKIHIDFYGYGSGSGQVYSYAINDGVTTGTPRQFTSPAAGRGSFVSLEQTFTYTTTANHTFEVFGATGSGTVSIEVDGTANGGGDMYFSIFKFPSANETIYTPDTYNWNINADIINAASGTYLPLGTSSSSSFTTPTQGDLSLVLNTGSLDAKITCNSTNPPTGLTCGAGTEEPGLNFNLPASGSVEICASFDHYIDTGAGADTTLFSWQETSSISQTSIQDCGPALVSGVDSGTQGSHHPTRVCGICNFTSSGNKTIRMQNKVAKFGTSTINHIWDIIDANLGQAKIHITARPLNQNIPAPVFVGSVITPSSGVEKLTRIEFGGGVYQNVCTAGTCTIWANPGSWVSSVTRAGAGDYTVNFSSSTFSAVPTCVATGGGAASDGSATYDQVTTQTTSTMRIVTYNAAGANADDYVRIMCMGPK
jgi:hypothetical protein